MNSKILNTAVLFGFLFLISACTPTSSSFQTLPSPDAILDTPAQTADSDQPDTAPPVAPPGVPPTPPIEPAIKFWLEPTASTLIGVDQIINVFSAFKENETDPFPAYLSSTSIVWSSSAASVATVGADGVVTGLKEGITVISARYGSYSSSLAIQVSGTMIKRSVPVSGQGTRKYSIYIPSFTGDPNENHPALLSLHGGGGTAMGQAASSQLNALANEQKFYVIYPEGSGVVQTFDAGACCGSAQSQNINDVLFIKTVISDVSLHYKINSSKVFGSGFSNGAIMSHRLACELSDTISGIAAVSGGSGEFDFNLNRYYTCNPSRPIPVLHFHASNDRNYAFAGGNGGGVSGTAFYPIDSTIQDWIGRNNVQNTPVVNVLTPTTKCYTYSKPANVSKASAPVTLCKIEPIDIYDPVADIIFGGGHSWPGGVRGNSASSDAPVTDFKANSYLWNFLNP